MSSLPPLLLLWKGPRSRWHSQQQQQQQEQEQEQTRK
jgi:hypothetical protein